MDEKDTPESQGRAASLFDEQLKREQQEKKIERGNKPVPERAR